MDQPRPMWSRLRPVLFAAAAATSWIALSASAANADSAADSDSLLTSISTSVGVASASVTDPARTVLMPPKTEVQQDTEANTASSYLPDALPKLQPSVHLVTTAADGLVSSIPAVNAPVTPEPVTTLMAPVLGLTDSVVGAAAEAILLPAGDVAEGLDPVAEPTIDPELPVSSPVPVDVIEESTGGSPGLLIAIPADPASISDPTASPTMTPADAATGLQPSRYLATSGLAQADASATCSQFLTPALNATLALPGGPAQAPLDSQADPLTGVSGSAGSAFSGGNSPSPAWLSAHHFESLRLSPFPARGDLMRAPSPTSFGPGSSPD